MRRGLSLLVQSFNRRFGPSSSKFRGDNLSLFSCPASRLSICSQLGFLLRFWWRSLFPSSNMVDEATVGIVCFANNAPGFRGILKQRYVYSIRMRVFTGTNCMYIHPYIPTHTYTHPPACAHIYTCPHA
mgnify:CR=1 FL=1